MAAKKKPSWTDEQLKAAMEDVQADVLSLRRAAAKYGVPRSSLHDRENNKEVWRTSASINRERGRIMFCPPRTWLSYDQGNGGSYYSRLPRGNRSPSPFVNNTPGQSWWECFLKRWPKLTERKPQHLPKVRALSSTPEVRNYSIITYALNTNALLSLSINP